MMSIESQVTSAGPARSHAHGPGGHGRGAAGAPVGGFASLLMNLESDAVALEDVPTVAGAKDDRADPATDALAAVDDAAQAAAPADLQAAAAAMAGPSVPVPAPGAEQELLRLRAAPMAGRTGLTGVEAAIPDDRQASTLDMQDMLLLQRQEVSQGAQGRMQTRPGQNSSRVPAGALAQEQGEPGAKGAKGSLRGEDLAARLGWKVGDASGAGQTAQAALLAATAADTVLRAQDQRHERLGARDESAPGVHGPLASLTSADGSRVEVPVVAADPGQMTQMRVAEQVSYWVTRGVQNAQLELEGLGEGAVSVSIELQGQEARIEFRAEQVHTRQALEGSVSHLRDLLEREGLVLSGVSVGASGADGGGQRQAPPRAGVRRGEVAVPELPTVAAPRAGMAPGRTVDYFV